MASVFLALAVAALIILLSSVITTGSIDWTLPFVAYGALLQGSIGSESAILDTILQATPLVLGGLAVGIGFKAGLFNIGGQGQFLLAATAAAGVGAALASPRRRSRSSPPFWQGWPPGPSGAGSRVR